MAFTEARISEVLALTANRIDVADEAIIFETLKQRCIPSHTDPARSTSANRVIQRREDRTALAMGPHDGLEGGQSRYEARRNS